MAKVTNSIEDYFNYFAHKVTASAWEGFAESKTHRPNHCTELVPLACERLEW